MIRIHESHIFVLRKIHFKQMKIIAVYTQLKQLRNKAWKKFRPERESNPWPLRYRCSALTNWAIKPTGSWSWCKYFSVLFCLYFIFFINCLSYVTYLLFTFLVSTFLLGFFVKTKVIVEKITLSLLHSQTFTLIAAHTIVLAVSPTFLTKLSGFEKCCLCRRL